MHFQNIFCLLLHCVLYLDLKGTTSSRITTEGNLRTLLWTTNSYDSLVRPDESVNVAITFYPMNLLDLNIADGSMSIVGFFSMMWTDSRLDWSSNAAYSSIKTVFSSAKYTWYPPFVLFNSISELEILMDADNQNPIRIINDGSCEYLMSRVMHTSCSTYATYYPFDTQTCNLVLAMWGYNEK
uniref:Acetylcholine receptor subunit beta-like n=1 Tax=Crassostrea virginica TaxID=6565 RepID=A0A8B8DHU5_CRAVI|nr:acetylcholine receptor subunit beta-like [Crassostrea virginica]